MAKLYNPKTKRFVKESSMNKKRIEKVKLKKPNPSDLENSIERNRLKMIKLKKKLEEQEKMLKLLKTKSSNEAKVRENNNAVRRELILKKKVKENNAVRKIKKVFKKFNEKVKTPHAYYLHFLVNVSQEEKDSFNDKRKNTKGKRNQTNFIQINGSWYRDIKKINYRSKRKMTAKYYDRYNDSKIFERSLDDPIELEQEFVEINLY